MDRSGFLRRQNGTGLVSRDVKRTGLVSWNIKVGQVWFLGHQSGTGLISRDIKVGEAWFLGISKLDRSGFLGHQRWDSTSMRRSTAHNVYHSVSPEAGYGEVGISKSIYYFMR